MNEPSANDIEVSRGKVDRLENWSMAAGLIVFLGLAIEIAEARELVERWPLLKFAWGDVVGAALVALGVLGEVIFSRRIAVVSRNVEQEAETAVSAARLDAAEALRAAAESNQIAEHERLERVRLEAELSPRFFKNQDKSIERLRAFKGTKVILSYPLDLECHQTAEQIAFVLDGAGWLLTARVNADTGPLLTRGVIVDGPVALPLPKEFGPQPQAAGSVLVEELNNTGIDADFPPGIPGQRPEIFVHVGMKASPYEKLMHKRAIALRQSVMEGVAAGTPPDMEPLIRAMLDKLATLGPGGAHGNRLILPRTPSESSA
jgi:hypothetical protein